MIDQEFNADEKRMLRQASFRILADSVAECGPYQITKAGKSYRIVNFNVGPEFNRRKNLRLVINEIVADRKCNWKNWTLKYDFNKIFAS